MKRLIITLIIGLVVVITLSLVAHLHCRVIKLEQDLELTRGYIQELQEAVFEGDNIVEVGPGGWLKLVGYEREG